MQSGSVLDRDYSYDGMGNVTEIDRNSMPDDLVPVYPYSYTDDYSFVPASASTTMKQYNAAVQPARLHVTSKHNAQGNVTVKKEYAIQAEE